MTNPEVAIFMLSLFILLVLLGFPIAFTLVAMGLGFGNATSAVEGFGILCMASIGPIIAVLTTGLWTRFQAYRQFKSARRETEISHGEEAPAIL